MFGFGDRRAIHIEASPRLPVLAFCDEIVSRQHLHQDQVELLRFLEHHKMAHTIERAIFGLG
jgi:hypothetical protein